MKSFEKFLTEATDPKKPEQKKPSEIKQTTPAVQPGRRVSDDLITTFGRYNPPHLGHGRTLDYANKLAGSIGDNMPADQTFYASKSQDPKKNPLPFELKLEYLRKMFPDHANKWDDDPETKTIMDAAVRGFQKGYKNFHFVGGQDRRQGMEDLLRKYNGQLYNFKNIYSHSAGDRDEQSEDPIAKLSASGQRRFAMNDDFEKFKEGMKIDKKNFTMQDARRLFDNLRMFMTKNEDWEIAPKDNQEFLFEHYKNNDLFRKGDLVEHDITGLVGKVHRCGTNYVISLTEEGICFKSFIHQLSHLNT